MLKKAEKDIRDLSEGVDLTPSTFGRMGDSYEFV